MSLVVKRITFIGTAIPGQIGNTFRITTAQCPILNQFESIYDPFTLHYFVMISLFLEGYFMVIVMAPYKWDILGKNAIACLKISTQKEFQATLWINFIKKGLIWCCLQFMYLILTSILTNESIHPQKCVKEITFGYATAKFHLLLTGLTTELPCLT